MYYACIVKRSFDSWTNFLFFCMFAYSSFNVKTSLQQSQLEKFIASSDWLAHLIICETSLPYFGTSAVLDPNLALTCPISLTQTRATTGSSTCPVVVMWQESKQCNSGWCESMVPINWITPSSSAQTVLGSGLIAGATNAYPKQFEHLN